MSDISWQSQMSFGKGGLIDSFDAGAQGEDIVGDTRVFRNVQTVAVSVVGVPLDIGDITTAGMVMFQNLDSANLIKIGIEVSFFFYPLIEIEPGKIHGPVKISSSLPSQLLVNAIGGSADLFTILYEA